MEDRNLIEVADNIWIRGRYKESWHRHAMAASFKAPAEEVEAIPSASGDDECQSNHNTGNDERHQPSGKPRLSLEQLR